jgi:hypothetical protein
MRRTWAVLLVAIFSFTLIGPVALALSPDQKLALCCHRNGKHHCLSTQGQGDLSGPSVQMGRCSLFYGDQTIPPRPTAGAARLAQGIPAAGVSHPAPRPQTESFCRVSFDRRGQERGPPFLA